LIIKGKAAVMALTAFWDTIAAQLEELTHARTADDVLGTLAADHLPETGGRHVTGDGYFAGSDGDGTVRDVLCAAGWTIVWAGSDVHYVAAAPDGSTITYRLGDVNRGDHRTE
jgi:hypothetical protein